MSWDFGFGLGLIIDRICRAFRGDGPGGNDFFAYYFG